MFESLVKYLENLILPLDFIVEDSAATVISLASKAIVSELDRAGIDVYLLDVLWRDEIGIRGRKGVFLRPIIDGNDYKNSDRHKARPTIIVHNQNNITEDPGIWTTSYVEGLDIWIKDIQRQEFIRAESPAGVAENLDSGYIMLRNEVYNNLTNEQISLRDFVVYGETNDIILIPLIHNSVKVGLFSIEARNGNFTQEVYYALKKVARWFANLIWKLDVERYIKRETAIAVNEFKNFVENVNLNSRLPSYAYISGSSIFGEPESERYKSDIFVMMPFSEDYQHIFDDEIMAVANTLSLTAARGDFFVAAGQEIMHEVWSAIATSTILIADCTGRNPNVFYEIGIAHAIGKRVILIAQSTEDIPFDTRHLRHIIYKNTRRGLDDFRAELQKTVQSIINS
jgi:hypothetical protein